MSVSEGTGVGRWHQPLWYQGGDIRAASVTEDRHGEHVAWVEEFDETATWWPSERRSA